MYTWYSERTGNIDRLCHSKRKYILKKTLKRKVHLNQRFLADILKHPRTSGGEKNCLLEKGLPLNNTYITPPRIARISGLKS